MVQFKCESGLKRCAYCDEVRPVEEFYLDRRGVRSARCRDCHGLKVKSCQICGEVFLGTSSAKACSAACRRVLRPPTCRDCEFCGKSFPVPHLKRKFCSMACKVKAQTTGRKRLRRPTSKARRAQGLVRYHVSVGNLTRPDSCEECGATGCKIEAAHYNYDRPLHVRWLCRSCHVRWDKRDPKHGTFVVQISRG